MIELLQKSLIGLTTSTAPTFSGTSVMDTIQFASILFQIADKEGFIECQLTNRIANKEELRWAFGESGSLIYELPIPIFRPMLAGIAVWICSQDGKWQSFDAFNVYGDSREVEACKGEIQGRFHVEFVNRAGPLNFLRIRKLV